MLQRRINVIDISHHQSRDNIPNSLFPKLKAAGIFAVVHKATQGSGYVDPFYAGRQKAARDAGLLWGAYHFLDASDAKTQAAHFLDVVTKSADFEPHMLAADFEPNPNSQASLSQCMTFMRGIDAAMDDVQCALYSGNMIRETLKPQAGGHASSDMGGVVQFFQDHRLWLAEYNPRYRTPWPWNEPVSETDTTVPGIWLWQFTQSGRLVDIPVTVDGNFFDGTFDQLQSRWLA